MKNNYKWRWSDSNWAELGVSLISTGTIAFLTSVGELLITGNVHWNLIITMSVGKALLKVLTELQRADR